MPKAALHPFRSALVLLPLALAASGPGCASDVSTQHETGEPPAGAVRGEFAYNVATLDDGTSETDYFLKQPDGSELKLLFDSEPDVAAGTNLDVWVSPENGMFRVRHFEILPVSRIEQALIAGPSYNARSFAFVIVNNGTPPTPIAEADATRRVFGITPNTVPSVRQYYMEASYGRQDIAGMVVGPLNFTMTACNTGPLATALTPMVPFTANHYLWYIQPRNAACSWAGLAQGGTPVNPSRNTWYNASSGCVVLVQEPGHNFGMSHSSSMTCMGQPFADVPLGTCTHSEYGDRFDPMGGGCRHMNAFQKTYQGWLEKCNIVDSAVSGTYTLLPLELPCNGVQAITVPFGKVRPFTRSGGGGGTTTDQLTNYLIEMRAPIGIDSGLAATVQIRATSNLRDRTQRGLHTWILDMNPATTNVFDGLTVGQTFTDPAGSPIITVMALDNTKATVRVDVMAPAAGASATCLDDTPFTGPGPGTESCAPQVASAPNAPPAIPDGGATPPPPGPRPDAGGRDTAPPRGDAGPVTPPPGGSGGAGGSTPPPGTGGATGQGGAAGGGGVPVGDAGTGSVIVGSGCGCRLGSTDHTATGSVLACGLALVGLVFRRRRRR
jgi:Gametolysin peptidase M11